MTLPIDLKDAMNNQTACYLPSIWQVCLLYEGTVSTTIRLRRSATISALVLEGHKGDAIVQFEMGVHLFTSGRSS